MLGLVDVDPVRRQLVHEVHINLLLGQKIRHFGEKLFKSPHLLRVDLEEAGEDGGEVLLDALAEEAGGGQLAAPLDGTVLRGLDPGDDAARLLRGDVVHRLLVAPPSERSERKVSCKKLFNAKKVCVDVQHPEQSMFPFVSAEISTTTESGGAVVAVPRPYCGELCFNSWFHASGCCHSRSGFYGTLHSAMQQCRILNMLQS